MPIYKNQLPICGNYSWETTTVFSDLNKAQKGTPAIFLQLTKPVKVETRASKRNRTKSICAGLVSLRGSGAEWFSRDCSSLIFSVASFYFWGCVLRGLTSDWAEGLTEDMGVDLDSGF